MPDYFLVPDSSNEMDATKQEFFDLYSSIEEI